jgi:hypothetical protein
MQGLGGERMYKMYKTINRIKKARKAHTCQNCGYIIEKGEIYYRKKEFLPPHDVEDRPFFNEIVICPKCKYKEERHSERFEKFKEHCSHKVTTTMYRYIPGECVEEPDYELCLVCGKRF